MLLETHQDAAPAPCLVHVDDMGQELAAAYTASGGACTVVEDEDVMAAMLVTNLLFLRYLLHLMTKLMPYNLQYMLVQQLNILQNN